MNKIDNIRNLYKKVYKKTNFIGTVALDLQLSPQYVRCNYFSGLWVIPDKYQDRINQILQNTIRTQK